MTGGNVVDLELEGAGAAALDGDFDVGQAEGRIGVQAFLIEIDKGYPAVFAFATTGVRRHLRVTAARRSRRHRTEQAHLRKRPALNHAPGSPALKRNSAPLPGPASSRRAYGQETRRHC